MAMAVSTASVSANSTYAKLHQDQLKPRVNSTDYSPFWMTGELVAENCYPVDHTACLEVLLYLFWR